MKLAKPDTPVTPPDALAPVPGRDAADADDDADEALLDSSLDLKLGLQVEDVAETISNEDFDSLFGR